MAIPNISEIRDGKRVITKKPELLLPAGNLEKLKIAIHYGADAVFLGGQEFGLRSNADNFTIEEIKEGCEFAAKYGADIYVTANIIAHDENFEGLDEFLMGLQDAGVRGIIVADPYIIERCKAVAPKVEVHISTQQSISNYKEVRYWESEGVHRVVLARETGYEEIKEIREKTDVEIEMFVHGAMCIAYSGRCTLSNYMTARDSNRGGCCQSCRWNYDLYEEGTDEDTKLFDEGANPYAMSPKDLTLIEAVPEIIELGIDSLKVEGRMKSIHYVATVASVYRKLIDDYCADPDNFEMTPDVLTVILRCHSSMRFLSILNKCLETKVVRKQIMTSLGKFFTMMKKLKLQQFNNVTSLKLGKKLNSLDQRSIHLDKLSEKFMMKMVNY